MEGLILKGGQAPVHKIIDKLAYVEEGKVRVDVFTHHRQKVVCSGLALLH